MSTEREIYHAPHTHASTPATARTRGTHARVQTYAHSRITNLTHTKTVFSVLIVIYEGSRTSTGKLRRAKIETRGDDADNEDDADADATSFATASSSASRKSVRFSVVRAPTVQYAIEANREQSSTTTATTTAAS